ncbi:NAD(P)H-dependent glycerol-3-phosphate dehydrogenase [Roseovarius sp. M141]|uniref:NAD(P)H-dependent glycerol-3-phosphate dehydrogenase n=1 Tax=Roseovarius sp. M141 TaxID=2583806 RepID=UPI0020CE9CF9|nr:NAD(P)H-dependent glycerol-3-phosphate dehydrogenase [Roseovarius sp. M141]MCQ0094145.1 NAD(P)-dependent glycerol-3-phosphate dehydrogenase [Roseovarius sp. M141]
MTDNTVVVVGGGAWGTALACVAARAGQHAVLLCRDSSVAEALNTDRCNPRYLPGISLPDRIEAATDPGVLGRAGTVILAIPAQSLRAALPALAPLIAPGATLINTAKGIELGTGLPLSRVIADICPDHPQAVLSGPSFATDVAQGKPTAVTLAAGDEAAALDLCRALSSDSFRAYASADMTGVETGGALKNVYAIAAGVVIGLGFGESAKAALITRAFVELRRLGAAMGGQAETYLGLSGFGDLMLSCSSPQSRNFGYGMALGRGEDLTGRPLAEGAATVQIAGHIAQEHGVSAPILQATRRLIAGEIAPKDAVEALLSRPVKEEF